MDPIQVAAGVVINRDGRILIAKRPVDKHQGGLWEFPGGKIEAGESAHQALARELEEEVGIHIVQSEPLIQIRHAYPDKSVHLYVLRVNEFSGTARGREAQEVAWVLPEQLHQFEFPAANKPVIAAARLPRLVMVTGPFGDEQDFLARLQKGIDCGVGLVLLRAHGIAPADYISLARSAHTYCVSRGVTLMANCALEDFGATGCEGLHLTSTRLMSLNARPVSQRFWLSAACHDATELAHAQAIGVDFAYLSPVQPTASHPGGKTLGWPSFSELAAAATTPVYALGGVSEAELDKAIHSGAQGIAAISAFWQRS